jgi:hypothetical protein
MWYRSYRNHVIMAFPSFDTATSSWAPQADISWVAGPARESVFIRFPLRVMSENEAVASALASAEKWVDERKYENRELWVTAQNPETPAGELPIGTLLRRKSARQTQPILPPGSRRSQNGLTYDDFKANLVSLGMTASEGSLLKSYDALIRLRKTSHCSWAQIKSILKRCQNRGTTIQPPRRGARPAALPLTPQGWRRII